MIGLGLLLESWRDKVATKELSKPRQNTNKLHIIKVKDCIKEEKALKNNNVIK